MFMLDFNLSFVLGKKNIVPRREKVSDGKKEKKGNDCTTSFYRIVADRTCVATLNILSCKILPSNGQ